MAAVPHIVNGKKIILSMETVVLLLHSIISSNLMEMVVESHQCALKVKSLDIIIPHQTQNIIVVVNKTRLTWKQALDYCDKKHSGLLQILTPEHQKSVELWLSNTGYTETFWVGLRQSRVFGFWIWKDTMVNSSNWANGEQPVMPLSHQCGVIQAPGYTWRDHNCLHPLQLKHLRKYIE
uniref:C-type lectin domain-containing protein n=1 Tax=Periophthalmus magnuspinnatus TaxID=409849 RepID=A0A3B4ACF9_9GOBI